MTAMKRFQGEKPEKKENRGKSPVGKQRSPRKEFNDKPWKSDKKPSDRPAGKDETGEKKWVRKERSYDKPWRKDDSSDRPLRKKTFGDDKQSERPYNKTSERPWKAKREDSDSTRERKNDNGERPWRKRNEESGYDSRRKPLDGDKPWKKKEETNRKTWEKDRKTIERDTSWEKKGDAEKKSWHNESRPKPQDSEKKWNNSEPSVRKPWRKESETDSSRGDRQWKNKSDEKPWDRGRKETPYKKSGYSDDKAKQGIRTGKSIPEKSGMSDDGTVRLNKYIANAGICSRREADTMIQAGAVMVNGKIITELGSKVYPGDKVQIGDETLNPQKKIYLLLNKPKGYITTVDDPQERNTVMMLVKDACRERIYPVGRLDRNTSGLLLMTNDGEIAKKLTHPSHRVRKIYQVELNKAFAKSDMVKITEGIELEDGMMAVDEIAYTGQGDDKKNLGVVIHSGKNRIVRRMFEALDYEVVKLDRVAFANLTKKDLPRGRWRFLEESEVNLLKMI